MCACLHSYKNTGTLTWEHVWTVSHTCTHSQPCIITSCLLLELLSSLEWARQSRLYCVNLFVCQERLRRSLSLFVFSDGETARGTRNGKENGGGKRGWKGGTQEPGEPPELRRMAGHLAPLWMIMTGCLAMTHPHPHPELHPQSLLSCSTILWMKLQHGFSFHLAEQGVFRHAHHFYTLL